MGRIEGWANKEAKQLTNLTKNKQKDYIDIMAHKQTLQKTPIKAIRAKCLECQGNQYSKIRSCGSTNCPLYPYRLGKRPLSSLYSSKLYR